MAASPLRTVLTTILRSTLGLAPLAVLAGCALSMPPTSEELQQEVLLPDAPLPGQWTAGAAAAGVVADNWLAGFNDTDLEALVAEAMNRNADLRAAATRVERAAAQVRVVGGEIYPRLDFLGRAGGELGDNTGLEGGILSASWELDVWGRVRYNRRGAEAQYVATESDYMFARQSLAALVAKSWFLATEATLQSILVGEMVESATMLLDIAEQRLGVGVGNEFDVALARVNLDTFRDNLSQIELAREQSLRTLELLVGRYPAAELAPATQFGALPQGVPAGLPSELLERRPDVMAAEQRVATAFNRTQEAEAARLPRFSLTASGSDLSSDLFVLTERENPVWSIGGSVFAPLFAGGALRGQVEVRTAEQEEAIALYVDTALTAFGDVENALSSEFALEEREQILTSSVTDTRRALDLAEQRYRVGSGDLRLVSEQQLAYHAARMSLLRVQSERRVQRVNLHLALGGNFAPDA